MKHYSTRAEANRANAQLSTGPRTEEGKRIASHNALKTGLTGRTVLLPTDDADQYAAHRARVDARYGPRTDEERLLAESIAHTEWRLLRIPSLETSLLALGRKRCADLHADESPEVREALIEAEVFTAYEKQLANLALQEYRLTRHHEKQIARLQALIAERRKVQTKRLVEVANLYGEYQKRGEPFPLKEVQHPGYEFSAEELKHFVMRREAQRAAPDWYELAALEYCSRRELNLQP